MSFLNPHEQALANDITGLFAGAHKFALIPNNTGMLKIIDTLIFNSPARVFTPILGGNPLDTVRQAVADSTPRIAHFAFGYPLPTPDVLDQLPDNALVIVNDVHGHLDAKLIAPFVDLAARGRRVVVLSSALIFNSGRLAGKILRTGADMIAFATRTQRTVTIEVTVDEEDGRPVALQIPINQHAAGLLNGDLFVRP